MSDRELYWFATRFRSKDLGAGRHRITFDFGNDCVVKVPRNAGGVQANREEAEISAKWRDEPEYLTGVRFARCVLVKMFGVEVLVMEKVRPAIRRVNSTWPTWAVLIDSEQVGWSNRTNCYVAYDYSEC